MLKRILSTAAAVVVLTAAGASFAADSVAKAKCKLEHKGNKAAIAACIKAAK